MKTWLGLMLAMCALLTGCSTPGAGSGSATSGSPTSAGAASGGAACGRLPVVAWSSEEVSPSRLSAVGSGAPATPTTVDVKGIVVGGVAGNTVAGHSYFLSQGDAQHGTTHLIDLSLADCRARTVPLAGVVGPLAMTTDGSRFYTSNTLNFASPIRRFDASGALRAEGTVDRVGVTALVLGDGVLYAFADEFHDRGDDTYLLLALDPDTLAVRARHTLPRAEAAVTSAVFHGGRLIYPLNHNEATQAPGHELISLDPATMEVTTIDLGAPLPYLVRLTGDTLVVAHTYLNPAFGPLSSMRHVSTVDLTSGTVSGHDLDTGIIDLAVDATHAYVLGQREDNAEDYVVETVDLASMTRAASVTVKRPGEGGSYYAAGVLAP